MIVIKCFTIGEINRHYACCSIHFNVSIYLNKILLKLKMLHISDQKSLRIMFDLKLKLPLYKKDIKLNLTFYDHLTLKLVNDLSKGKIVLIMQQCVFYMEIQKTIKTFSNAYVPVKQSRLCGSTCKYVKLLNAKYI